MEKIYDMIIVGGGPAGLTASLYGLRNGKTTLVIEKSVFGGQIVNSPKVENIPGFESISGEEFGDLMLNQVTKQGGEVLFDNVINVESDGEIATVYTEMSEVLKAKTVILANGTTHRTLNLENEEKLIGKNIHFCAVCDGSFYKNKKVVMIGGGNSALVDSNFLINVVDKLTILQDLPSLTGEKRLQDILYASPKVDIHTSCKILEYVLEDGRFKGVKYLEGEKEKIIECDGVFLAIGLVPDNKAFEKIVELDQRGYYKANENGITKTKNIFVAGDARSKNLRQVATACSDGANAAIEAINYLR